jgi:hypothetical protein
MEAFLLDTIAVSRDAFLSQAWIYPLLGISYLLSHPKLYNALAPVVLKALLTSLGITTAMFFFTYLPQLAFCAIFSGPFAFPAAAVMVLGESYVLITFVSKIFFLNAAQDKLCKVVLSNESIFNIYRHTYTVDAVLVQQGHETIVSRGRQVKSNSAGLKVLGESLLKPLDCPERVLRGTLYLYPSTLSLIGTILFLIDNGKYYVNKKTNI